MEKNKKSINKECNKDSDTVVLTKKVDNSLKFSISVKWKWAKEQKLRKEFVHNNILLSLITDLLYAQSFNQEIFYTWITMETSVKVSATFNSFRLSSTWWRHGEEFMGTSWTYCNSCQLRRRCILSSTKQVVLHKTLFCPFF